MNMPRSYAAQPSPKTLLVSGQNSTDTKLEASGSFSGLYYPFSRTIDIASLKQMLLVFESVTFLDPVDNDWWRAKLFEQLTADEDKRFSSYERVHENLALLFQENAARRIDPKCLSALENSVTSASSLSDLIDDSWKDVASAPKRFGMPHRSLGPNGEATWQIFESKMPRQFIEALHSNESFKKHLVYAGHQNQSWTLTYEAGSSISISVHLAAAEEMGLSPVTDSAMHHELLIRKLIRNRDYTKERARPIDEKIVAQLTHSAMSKLIDELVPREVLETTDIEKLLIFRERTKEVRKLAVGEISNRLRVLSKVPEAEDLLAASQEVQQQIRTDLRTYRAELEAIRNKVWPVLIGSINTNLAAGSVAAVAMNYIGGPGHALVSSIVAGSMALLKGALDLKVERKKLEASRSPSVTYLAQVRSLH